MSQETEKIQKQIDRLRYSVRFAKVQTLVVDIEQQLARLEKLQAEEEFEPKAGDLLWPSFSKRKD